VTAPAKTDARARARQRAPAFAAFLVLGLIIAYLNRAHVEQQSNFFAEYVSMANHYRGLAHREILTYPLWGYPVALLLFPRYDVLVLAQVVLASIAATLLYFDLRAELPHHRRALYVLFLAAVPWYVLHSVKWPQSFAASFCLIGIVALARAWRDRSLPLAVAAGASFGLALYFRSEFLYFPLFALCLVAGARVLTRRIGPPVLPLAAAAAVAWALLVPWAVHYHHETGRYSLTASQRGIVAFISLGQLPNNPWGATYLDEYAYDYLVERGITVLPQSDSGDRLLFAEYERRVKAEPLAFAKKILWNGVLTVAGGFYNGEIPLTSAQRRQLERLQERIRGPLTGGIAARPGIGGARVETRVGLAFTYWLVAKVVGSAFILISLCGLALRVFRGIRSPLLILLASFIAYQWLLVLVLATEPRYMNGLFLAMVPFFISALDAIRSTLGRQLPAASRVPDEARLTA
jgi:hypothetical protein